MAVRRKAPARKTAVRRRRRRPTMGAAFTPAKVSAAAQVTLKASIGGVIAAAITNALDTRDGSAITALEPMGTKGLAPYAGLAGSIAAQLFLKQPEIAAGMAGYSAPKAVQALMPESTKFLAAGGNDYSAPASMYLQDRSNSGIYASDYTLADYGVPGMN